MKHYDTDCWGTTCTTKTWELWCSIRIWHTYCQGRRTTNQKGAHFETYSTIEAYCYWSLEHCLNMYLHKEQYFIYLAPLFSQGCDAPDCSCLFSLFLMEGPSFTLAHHLPLSCNMTFLSEGWVNADIFSRLWCVITSRERTHAHENNLIINFFWDQ